MQTFSEKFSWRREFVFGFVENLGAVAHFRLDWAVCDQFMVKNSKLAAAQQM